MKEHLFRYFRLRRRTAIVYFLIGLPALTGGLVLFRLVEERIWEGLLISVAGLAVIKLWTGIQLWRRTARLAGALPETLRRYPDRFRQGELQRCQQEEGRYNKQRTAVLLLIALGIVLALVGGVIIRRPFTAGMGFGLCLAGAVLLVLNLQLHWHQSLYQHAVERFDVESESL